MQHLTYSIRTLAIVLCLAIAQPAIADDSSPYKRFNQWLHKAMQDYQIPAVSIVVIRDYKIDWIGTYGVKNIFTEEPVTDTTLFQAGSISKLVTAVAVVIAVQDNDIKLDENINQLLTSWKLPEIAATKNDAVTVQELLSHTAGINVPGFIGYEHKTPLPTLIQVLNGTTPANSSKIKMIDVPGENYRYSGGGYVILQQMLTDVYHKPYSDLMEEMVLQPLSMSNSTFDQPLPTRFADAVATPYRPGFVSVKGGPHTYVEQASSGLWTTPFDLAKFTISIQESLRGNPYQILKPKYAHLMMQPVTDNMGLGFMVNMNKYGVPAKNGRYFMHYGQNEGYRSVLIASTKNGYGAIIMTNMSPSGKLVIANKVKDDGFMDAIIAMLADLEDWR